jgi:hypothetical protein
VIPDNGPLKRVVPRAIGSGEYVLFDLRHLDVGPLSCGSSAGRANPSNPIALIPGSWVSVEARFGPIWTRRMTEDCNGICTADDAISALDKLERVAAEVLADFAPTTHFPPVRL